MAVVDGSGVYARRAVPPGTEDPLRRAEWLGRLFLSSLLILTVLAVLVPTISFGPTSRVFLLKLGVAGILSLLPGWLYLQFIRNKGQSLYDEYVINLFRLHIDEYRNLPAPPQHTSYHKLWKEEHDQLGTKTKDNLYRKKFESVYGRSSVSTLGLITDRSTVRDRTETFGPVLLATALLCLGWVLVLQPELLHRFDLFSGIRASSRQPQFPSDALQFGFLGAYSFILQDLIRRYFRDDLKTGAYISAVVRVVFVSLVVTVVDLLWPTEAGNQELIFAFFIGFFPQVGLQALQAALAKPLGKLIPSMRSEYPLSDLDGLNVWYEARLAEEGIDDMQNLASANLVDLILRTRAPIARLVDWLDQAFLYLYLPQGKNVDSLPRPRERLRRLGIRTATDLERASEALDDAGRKVLSRCLSSDEAEGAACVKALLESLKGEVNLWHVRQFRGYKWLLRDEERHGIGEHEARHGAGTYQAPRPPQVALATPPGFHASAEDLSRDGGGGNGPSAAPATREAQHMPRASGTPTVAGL